jgi:hypothetical protein
MPSTQTRFKGEIAGNPVAVLRQKRKSPTQIDWKKAASLMAGGTSPEAIAGLLGIPEDRIWRHLRDSLRFRFYLRQAMERQALLARIAFAATAPAAVVAYLRQAQGLDPESMRWLAQHTGVIDAAAAQAAGEDDLVEQLGETGRRRRAEAPRTATNTSEASRSPASASEQPRTPASASEQPRNPAGVSDNAQSPLRAGEAAPGALHRGHGGPPMPDRSPVSELLPWAMVRGSSEVAESPRRPAPG